MNMVKKNNNYILEWLDKNNKSHFVIFKNKEDIEKNVSNRKIKKLIFDEIAKSHPEILV